MDFIKNTFDGNFSNIVAFHMGIKSEADAKRLANDMGGSGHPMKVVFTEANGICMAYTSKAGEQDVKVMFQSKGYKTAL